jgi:hypothetical protein
MPDPASWKVIESGWIVVDRYGAHVGTIDDVVGDKTADIFDGITVKTHHADGEVRLAIGGDAVPPSADLRREAT